MTYYRLIFRDGSHGAWTTNRIEVEEDAKFFHATIEIKEVKLP